MIWHVLIAAASLCLFDVTVAKSGMTGGWTQVSTKEQGVQGVSQFASQVISDRSNSYYLKKLIHVHLAQRQVVAGWKYNVTFDLGATICRKNEVSAGTVEQCTVSPTHVSSN